MGWHRCASAAHAANVTAGGSAAQFQLVLPGSQVNTC